MHHSACEFWMATAGFITMWNQVAPRQEPSELAMRTCYIEGSGTLLEPSGTNGNQSQHQVRLRSDAADGMSIGSM